MNDWHKNAIIYGIEVKTFYDGNNDGIGDFVGLTQKLDYLKALGITTIWLLPFYPSGDRDNGYDITNYYAIDPRLGTLDEFKHFVAKADEHGIRVIIDLVIHHTSNLHVWFEDARKNPNSLYKDYYIWTKKIPEKNYPEVKSAFPGIEPGSWSFDGYAKEFYFHKFYYFEPDLHIANPKVQKEILSIMEFWMQTGIAGFRIDAATLLFDRKGLPGTEVSTSEEFLQGLNSYIKKFRSDAILLGEVDVQESKVQPFFGDGNRLQLLYNFLLNRYIFLGLARQDGRPIREELQKLPYPPTSSQWVNFLRNLDELNIDLLSPSERKEVFSAFGSHPSEHIYDRGIRRRLAPMLKGDMRHLKMAFSLLFSLPGATLFVYGDEIGMGDYLDLPEREAVRIPMQWDSSLNAGFSKVNPVGIIRKVLSTGRYRYDKLNVALQIKDKASLLYHVQRLCTLKKAHKEIGSGEYTYVDAAPGHILAMSYAYQGGQLLIIHNLSPKPESVHLPLFDSLPLEDIFSDSLYKKEETADSFPVNGYGYRWFILRKR